MTRRTRLTSAVAGVAALVAAGIGAMAPEATGASTSASRAAPKVLFRDTFKNGFDTTKWQLFDTNGVNGPIKGGDGEISTSATGLTVTPRGVNPKTGLPAFTSTTASDATGFGGGTGDHLKWVAQPAASAKNGVPVPEQGALHCRTSIAAVTTGVDDNPFGRKAVSDPQSDPRLASATLITVDHESHTVANFSITNREIYVVYERLPVEGSSYAAFNYSIPVASTLPGQRRLLEVRFDQNGKRVSWLVDGKVVLSTDKIGTLAFPRKYLVFDHGGTPEQVSEQDVQCALTTGDFLDGAGRPQDRDRRGLVRLDSDRNFYYDPQSGPPHPQRFLHNQSRLRDRLFGQGVILYDDLFEMTTTG